MKLVCRICGYTVEGDKAPEKCPICRAPGEGFEDYDLKQQPQEEQKPSGPPKEQVCSVCGYTCPGPYAPERCPICKAPPTAFNPVYDSSEQ